LRAFPVPPVDFDLRILFDKLFRQLQNPIAASVEAISDMRFAAISQVKMA
jgi:hypothetical protein